MPKYTKKRRGTKRYTKTRRGFTKKRRSTKIPRSMPLITGNTHMVKMRFIEITTMSLGNSLLTTDKETWQLNSAYSPNPSALSTSMPGFNEWAALYEKYKVMACKWTCTFVNMQPNPIYAGMVMNSNVTTTTGWGNLLETRGNLNAKQVLLDAYPAAGNKQTISMYRKMGTLWGNRKEYLGDDNFGGNYNADPPNLIDGILWVGSFDGATAVGAINPIKVELEMWVKFYNKKIVFN